METGYPQYLLLFRRVDSLVYFLPQPPLNVLSWIVYGLLITYVLCIELPAYFIISSFDYKFADSLEGLRKELIEMPFSFKNHLQALKDKRNGSISLHKGESFGKLLDDFISFSERIENYNEKVWAPTLNETSALIDDVSKRSKHHFLNALTF